MSAAPPWVEAGDLRLLAQASAELRQWSASLGAPLQAAFAAMAATTGAAAADGAEPYLLPVSQPVVLLPLWLARRLPEQTVVDLVGSALAGYLAVRVQDDWCDRRVGDASAALLLSTALTARHAALVGRHPVGAAYWQLHADCWARYAVAMVLEQQLAAGDGPYGEGEFQQVLDRSRPVILPGAAALALTDRWSELAVLSALVDHLVASHQRFDDLRDGLDDLRAGERTAVLARAGAKSPGAWLAWLASGGAETELTVAHRELAAAGECARRLGCTSANLWIAAREGAMRDWLAQLRHGPLAMLLKPEKN